MEMIRRDFLEMPALNLSIRQQRTIKKAIIPAAGFGTRMFPVTKVVKKELLPIIDSDGRAKPIILKIVEEAVSAGVEEVGIIVQKGDLGVFQDFFQARPSQALLAKLSAENHAYSDYLQTLGQHITFIIQEQQEGFGHAVFCAKNWLDNEPFLLFLGDHIYRTTAQKSCAQQVLTAFHQADCSVVGLTVMSEETIQKAGCAAGIWQIPNSLLKVTQLYEKPEPEYAKAHLHVTGMEDSEYLGMFGIYALSPDIFNYLEIEIENNFRSRGEFQLTTCLERLRAAQGLLGLVVAGQYFDVGMPQIYRQTMQDF